MNRLQQILSRINRYSLAHIKAGHSRKIRQFLVNKPRTMLFRYPRHLLIEPSLRCNIKCPLCPSPLRLNPRRKIYHDMSLADFKAVVDNCKEILYRVYLSFSGEPLINDKLPDMVSHLTKSGIVSMISTNATLLSQRTAASLIRAGLDYMIISFDGFSKKSFESFRVGANFEKTLENILKVAQLKTVLGVKKPYIDIQWINNRLNEDELDDARKYFTGLAGIDEFHAKSLSLNEHIYDEKTVDENKRKYLSAKNKIRPQYVEGQMTRKGDKCPALLSPVVLANGDLTICCIDFKGEFVVGNLVTTPFKQIWHSTKYRKLRKKGDRMELAICRRCPIRYN